MITLDQLRALGLERSPFAQRSSPDLYFATPALRQRLDLIHHLLESSGLLLVVVGPPGSGRSSFLAKVLEEAAGHWRCAPVTAASALGARALLERIMGGLDVPNRGTLEDEAEKRLRRLAEHLESLVARGELAVIFVDDAGALEDDAIELVLQLALRSESLGARIALAGDEALVHRILSIADRGEVKDLVHLVELPTLTEEQAADYLHTRLAVAGMPGDTPFSPDAVARIWRESQGRPRDINELAAAELVELALIASDDARRSRIRAVLMQWWKGVAVVSVATVMLGLAVVLLPPQTPKVGLSAPPPLIKDLAVPSSPTGRSFSSEPGVVKKPKDDGARFIIHGDPVPTSAPVPKVETSPVAGASDTAASAPREVITTQAFRGFAPLPREPDVAENRLAKLEGPSVAGKIKSKHRLLSNTARLEPLASGSKVKPAAGGPQPLNSRAIHGASWVQEQPPESYTIQLMGTFDEAALRRFIAASGIGKRGAWFRSRHQGRAWFVAVYGSYPNRPAALAAARLLPKRIAPRKTWVRKVADVVQAIE